MKTWHCLRFAPFGLLVTNCACAATGYTSYTTAPVDSVTPADSLLTKQLLVMQSEMGEIKNALHSLEVIEEENNERRKRVQFGLSLGYRWLTPGSGRMFVNPSVSPVDSSLRLTRMESTSYLFSTSMIFNLNLRSSRNNPEEKIVGHKSRNGSSKNFQGTRRSSTKTHSGRTFLGNFLYQSVDRLCLVSNLNILDFSSGQKELAFNKSIEGGLGVGYRINETMYVGFNWEHVHSWQLYDDIKKFEGKKVVLNGVQLTSSNQLDTENDDLFYKKNLNGWSVKMIVAL